MNTEHTPLEEQQLLNELDRFKAMDDSTGAEPPLMIDQAVKNRARRELEERPEGQGKKLQWIAGLSTASIALIALGISLVQTPTNKVPPPSIPTPIPDRIQSMPAEQPVQLQRESRRALQPEPNAIPREAGKVESHTAAPTSQSLSSTDLAEEMNIAGDSGLVLRKDERFKDEADEVNAMDPDKPDTRLPAEAWMDLIKQLHVQGMETEAREQLAAFRQAYPDYVLPAWTSEIMQTRGN